MKIEQLERIALQAMDYLDSVGIAADWGIKTDRFRFLLIPIKRRRCFIYFYDQEVELSSFKSLICFFEAVNESLILKSPN